MDEDDPRKLRREAALATALVKGATKRGEAARQLLQDAAERWKAYGAAKHATEAERAYAAVMVDTAERLLKEAS